MGKIILIFAALYGVNALAPKEVGAVVSKVKKEIIERQLPAKQQPAEQPSARPVKHIAITEPKEVSRQNEQVVAQRNSDVTESPKPANVAHDCDRSADRFGNINYCF